MTLLPADRGFQKYKVGLIFCQEMNIGVGDGD